MIIVLWKAPDKVRGHKTLSLPAEIAYRTIDCASAPPTKKAKKRSYSIDSSQDLRICRSHIKRFFRPLPHGNRLWAQEGGRDLLYIGEAPIELVARMKACLFWLALLPAAATAFVTGKFGTAPVEKEDAAVVEAHPNREYEDDDKPSTFRDRIKVLCRSE
jgi:hypothetical protein